ncbi:MAG: hypothetical protein ACK5CW_03855 [Verrucomicrobiota bacterium]
MSQLNALLIGQSHLTFAPIPLLLRAGFSIDAISLPIQHRSSRLLHSHRTVSTPTELLDTIPPALHGKPYDLICPCDDETLQLIAHSHLPEPIRQQVLPVTSPDHTSHLYSKSGLSLALANGGVLTPDFRVVRSRGDFAAASSDLGFPFLAKLDSSWGGRGIFRFLSAKDIARHLPKLTFPLVLQRLIPGPTLDLSGFYQNTQLIHFTSSERIASSGGPHGVSKVRRFTQLSHIDPTVFPELQTLGRAVGAHGFSNVTAILSETDGQRYYVECDLRPTVWADHGRLTGNDAAPALRNWFLHRQPMTWPQPHDDAFPATSIIPYLARFSAWDLLTNRYRAWDFTTPEATLIDHLKARPLPWLASLARQAQSLIPAPLWNRLRSFYGRKRRFV